jgi:hypothetical protein
VLISIVIALGVSEIISSWGALLKNRFVVRFYWIHTGWTILVLLLLMQFWWGFWNYRLLENWSFFALAAVVGEAILLVLTGSIITPSRNIDGPLDLRIFYYDNCPVFFTLGAILIFILGVVNFAVGNQAIIGIENGIRAVGILVALVGAKSRSVMVHSILLLAGFALLLYFIVIQIVR